MSFGIDPDLFKSLRDFQFAAPNLVKSDFDISRDVILPPLRHHEDFANVFYEKLVKMINDFGERLNQSEEVGVRLVSFGQTVTFSVEDIGY